MVAAAAIVAAFLFVGSSAAGTPTEKKLIKQVAVLQAQVKVLQKQVKQLQKRADSTLKVVGLSIVYTTCLGAVTTDALQGTWTVIDQIAQPLQQKTYFGPQAPVDDFKSCTALGVARSQAVPPSVSVFSTLLTVFNAKREG
jgi:hypothetical protein